MKKLLSLSVILLIAGSIGFKAYNVVAYDASREAAADAAKLEARKAELYDYFSAAIFRYMPVPDDLRTDGIPQPCT